MWTVSMTLSHNSVNQNAHWSQLECQSKWLTKLCGFVWDSWGSSAASLSPPSLSSTPLREYKRAFHQFSQSVVFRVLSCFYRVPLRRTILCTSSNSHLNKTFLNKNSWIWKRNVGFKNRVSPFTLVATLSFTMMWMIISLPDSVPWSLHSACLGAGFSSYSGSFLDS